MLWVKRIGNIWLTGVSDPDENKYNLFIQTFTYKPIWHVTKDRWECKTHGTQYCIITNSGCIWFMHICMLNTFRLLILLVIKAFNRSIWRCIMAVPQYNLALTGASEASMKKKHQRKLNLQHYFLFNVNSFGFTLMLIFPCLDKYFKFFDWIAVFKAHS